MTKEQKDQSQEDNQVDSLLTEIANYGVVATIAIALIVIAYLIFEVSTGLK